MNVMTIVRIERNARRERGAVLPRLCLCIGVAFAVFTVACAVLLVLG